jgi:hypothetical protein
MASAKSCSIQGARGWLVGTSAKIPDAAGGVKAAPRMPRTRNTAICARVTVWSGQYVGGFVAQPPVIPGCTSAWTQGQKT